MTTSSDTQPPPRILLIAENCNPAWTSVPLVGWSHYQALARVVDVHLVTQVRNRGDLLAAGLVEGRDFTAIDSEKVAGPAHRVGEKLRGGGGRGWTTKMLFNRFGRVYFEKLVWRTFRDRLAGRAFDLVHQVTPLSPTLPARMATHCRSVGVPFVWGPLNGGLPWPRGFAREMTQEREWLSRLRGLHRLLPGYRSTRRDATAILIGSRATWDQMPAKYRDKCFYQPENAIDPARFSAVRTRVATTPVRALFLGRLVPYKGAAMLLEAAEPLLRAGTLTLDFIGDGPQRAELESQISNLKLSGVRFLGQLPHDRLQSRLVEYDVLAFPSIREFGGAVALEAMALGVVPIVPDYGGLGELVSDDAGYRIPMGTREQLVARFRERLASICAEPGQLAERSRNGIARARRDFTWDAKARRVLELYDWLLGRGRKPEWGVPARPSAA